MTKYCEACRTANRDRAQYCRGCAGRFKDANSAAVIPRNVIAPKAASDAASRQPAPVPVSRRPGVLRLKPSWLRVMLPAGAALSAALMVWQLWHHLGLQHPPSRSVAGLQAQPPQAERQMEPTRPPLQALSTEPPRIAMPPAAAPAPKETLLGLTLDQGFAAQPVSRATGVEKLLRVPSDDGETIDAMDRDGGTPIAGPVGTTRSPRPAAPRRVVANAAPVHAPGGVPFKSTSTAALGITGPCNRYNPYGEAICANPAQPGLALSPYRSRSTQSR